MRSRTNAGRESRRGKPSWWQWRRWLGGGSALLGGLVASGMAASLWAQEPSRVRGPVLSQPLPTPTLPAPEMPSVLPVAQQPMNQGQGQPQPQPQPQPARGEQGPPPRKLPPNVPSPVGSTPKPTPKELEEYGKFVQGFVDPRNTMDLILNRTRLMILKDVPSKIQVADERVARANPINPRQLLLQGLTVGSTVLTVWFRDPDDPNKEKILSWLVRVLPDPESRRQREASYKALEEEINEAFPDSRIRLFLVGDKLAVCGQAKDIADATQILRIVRANAPAEESGAIPIQNLNVTVAPGGEEATPGLRDFLTAGGPNVINLIKVPGEQQVMLRVTVAEINRSAARSIGLNFSITNNQGIQVFANRTGNIATGGSAFLFGGGGGFGGVGGGAGAGFGAGLLTNNLPVALDNGQIQLAINALRNLNYARSLAEPNLVALNGQSATFQAGGQFPVPVVTAGFGGFGGGLQGVNFVPFGVQLQFTPYITDKDKIRLQVAAEVSTRDLQAGANVGGTNVPGLNTRNFQTTVELREGQTLAVAGLIQNNIGADARRVPGLGDLPVLSRLLGYDTFQSGEQELVLLVTPEIVTPMDPREVPPVPGSDVFEPGDLEFYVLGRLESLREMDYRSPVRTSVGRMKAYRRFEEVYILGPSGHTENPEH